MTGRFDRPGLLATVTRAAVLDGTAPVIRNAVTHATARRVAAPRGSERDDGRATDHPAGWRPYRRLSV
ncbi:hypothetical protein E1212_18890 [Jiangella ureilytica]|uniref:Uncharacterized protein n=1 Tax=Jiangella ureilytica TaxID=2530374 RepID=A0A4R4RIX2_9ACTN|nr:hypothetical protein [Jiangella ureilytica]TDC49266.1 hypothetical protein E1212_18890 [Jiangella ureilytica]